MWCCCLNALRAFLFYPCLVTAPLFTCWLLMRVLVWVRRGKSPVVGFFHPYCNAGGGGERVLWCAVRALRREYPSHQCVVYTGDADATPHEIVQKARATFNIPVDDDVKFVFLRCRGMVEAKHYPVLTLLGQSVGSMVLGLEALLRCPPDVFLDTMGYAFTLPIFKYMGGCRTGCYVHYPTISSDMLGVVECRNNSFNNRALIARSPTLTYLKLLYYRWFAWAYGHAGRCSEQTMVNSSWTSEHIRHIWKQSSVSTVFPPCDITGFLKLRRDDDVTSDDVTANIVLSVAQFRPEKNHALQVHAFHNFLQTKRPEERQDYKLIMAGGCRNDGDRERVEELRELSRELEVEDRVEIRTNISFHELQILLSRARVGIHTMENEHFGIGVVEFQAAGVIVLAHASGGPKMDIVTTTEGERTGFLADDVTSYARSLDRIFALDADEVTWLRSRSRDSCARFSEQTFQLGFLRSVAPLMLSRDKRRL